MTVPPKPAAGMRDRNVDYFNLPEDTLYYDAGSDSYLILPEGDVMEMPTVYFEKETGNRIGGGSYGRK
jgi:hypothetical protein